MPREDFAKRLFGDELAAVEEKYGGDAEEGEEPTGSLREVVEFYERRFDDVVEEVREGVEAVSESARAFAELGEDVFDDEEDRHERTLEKPHDFRWRSAEQGRRDAL